MTNKEKIQTMSTQELAAFLEDVLNNTKWMDWWLANYCDKCESEFATCKALGLLGCREEEQVVECTYCEKHEECRFFKGRAIPSAEEICQMWLETETEGD